MVSHLMDPDAQEREWEKSKKGKACLDCAECEQPGWDVIDEGTAATIAADAVKCLCSPREDVSRTIDSIADEMGIIFREAQRSLCWCRAHGEFVRGYDPVDDCQDWREP